MPRDLDAILDDMKAEMETLAKNGAGLAPERVQAYREEIELATQEYRRWLDEETVLVRSGKGRAYWRGRFPELLELGMARVVGEGRRARRQYRACVVPVHAPTSSVVQDAQAAARRVKVS